MYRVGQGARTCAMPGVDGLQQSDALRHELADTLLKYWSYSHRIRHRYCFVETPKRKECKSFFPGPERLYLAIFIVELGVLNVYINIYNLKRPKAKILNSFNGCFCWYNRLYK